MSDFDDMNVQQIMERIREGLRAHVPGSAPPAAGVVSFFGRELDDELASLAASVDLFQMSSPRGRRILGPVVTLVRRVLLRLLTPVLAKQTTYNATNARIAERLRLQCDIMADHQARVTEEMLAAQSTLRAMIDSLVQGQGRSPGKDLP